MNHIPLIIGIAGGSGAGKSWIADRLARTFSGEGCTLLHEDNYYKNLAALPVAAREMANFDHPDALDYKLLADHLSRLTDGQAIRQPLYDFRTHCRLEETKLVTPGWVILLEGILLFHFQQLRRLIDIKVFVRTPEAIRFKRRLLRDTAERGRSADSVLRQYRSTVLPMYRRYVKPCERFADIIISGEDGNDQDIVILTDAVRAQLRSRR